MHAPYPLTHARDLCFGLLGLLVSASAGRGALVIRALETEHLINFDSTVVGVANGQFAGAGFSPLPALGQLDSDSWSTQGWASGGSVSFGGTSISGEFARGSTTSAVTSTGIYSYGTSDRQLLLQPGNTPAFGSESITLKVENQTDRTITGWTIGYDAFRRNDSPFDSWLVVDISTNGSTWYSMGDYFAVFLNNSGLSDGLGWVKAQTHLHTFEDSPNVPFAVADGGNFYIRWRTFLSNGNVASARDEWGIDNIRITAIPEPSSVALFIVPASLLLRRKRIHLP